jgi:hypothetical protein
MTLAQVERILGGRAGDYETYIDLGFVVYEPCPDLRLLCHLPTFRVGAVCERRWVADQGDLIVLFDKRDEVVSVDYCSSPGRSPEWRCARWLR